jgi:hypothetical protein
MSQDIDQATKDFESQFASVRSRENNDGDDKLPYYYSGGICSSDEVAPALFSSSDRAIESWIDTVFPCASSYDVLEWVLKPELVSYQMTMADMKQRHRVVSNRYCVKAQFVVHKV